MSVRPFRVTLLLWLVLTVTAWNAIRAWTALSWRSTLLEFNSSPGALFLGISGLFWFILGITLLYGILGRKGWARALLLCSIIGYLVFYWMERLIWEDPRLNWPLALIAQLLLVMFIIFTSAALTREAHVR